MMGSPNSELTLDCKPQSYSMLLKSFGDSNNTTTHQLEEYLSCLEQERLKIEAFKRELPLCIHLLSNAMETSRQQLQSYKATSGNQLGLKRPILEEFIPMKHSNSQGPLDQQNRPDSISDKATWMTSAQLWSQGPTTTELQSSKDLEMGFNPKLSLFNTDSNKRQQRIGGAFLPFTKETNTLNSDLALASDEQNNKGLKSSTESGLPSENSAKMSMENTDQTNVSGAAATNTTTTCTTTTTSQTRRKQRRCWSPDLHRRFVNALQMLGGSQVATPKQIRELMKVDGLTNDEVKSHLQKYRLHTRKPGPSPQGPPGPQLVVLGGIWVPTEYHHGVPPPTIYTAQPTAAAASQVGPHYCPPAIPQEFYPHPPLPPQHHHQLQLYKASSQGQRSPESCGRRGEKDRSESIEDGKSESSSGEESNDRKKQEGDEQSNEAQIILKF